MHRFASILVVSFSATVFVPAIGRCDELEDRLSVDEIVTNWRRAVATAERVDVEFVRFETDQINESVIVSKGRLAIDHERRVAISVEPFDGPVGELPMGRKGNRYERRKGSKVRLIFDHQMVLSIDDDNREAICLELAQPLPSVPSHKSESVQAEASFFERLGRLTRASHIFLITQFQLIGPLDVPCENLPQLAKDLRIRFDIQIIKQTQSNVRLGLTPLWPWDQMSFQRIDIILSRETWFPEAVRFADPAGTKATTFKITQRRVNECSEQTDVVFRVNLDQYRCDTIRSPRTRDTSATIKTIP